MRRTAIGAALAAIGALAMSSCGGGSASVTAAAPADSTAVAVIELEPLRAASVYKKLPAAARSLTEPLKEVKHLALCWNGKDLLMLAAGFKQVPAGYTEIGRGIAATGSTERIAAARKALNGGTPVIQQPQGPAEIRATLFGDGKLPLTANLANAGNLLRMATTSTVTVHVENEVELEVAAQCASSGKALQLEQSLRAMVTLAIAGSKDPSISALLQEVRIERENILVRVHTVASAEAFAKAFGAP
jgi:hypothetical protein